MTAKLITFEGGEGAGKGTQVKLLLERLKKEGLQAESSFEPGGTDIGLECRRLLKSIEFKPNKITELFLFEASRSEYCEKIVKPFLDKGIHFISDRFYDSSTVYQGFVRGLDIELVNNLNIIATNNLIPDLTIILDVNYEDGCKNAVEQARFELENKTFHDKIYEYYRELPKYLPNRNFVVIPRKSIEEVHEIIWVEVKKILNI